MGNPETVFRFSAPLRRFEREGGYYYVDFPGSVPEIFDTAGSVRMIGRVAGLAAERSLIPHGDGTHYVVVNGEMRREAGLHLGDTVEVELRPHPEPYAIEMPEELTAGLEMDPAAQNRFQRLSHGDQRTMALYVSQAKRPETRAKRAADFLRRLQSDSFVLGGRMVKL